MTALFLSAFITLFVVIDPPGCAPIYAGLTKGATAAQQIATRHPRRIQTLRQCSNRLATQWLQPRIDIINPLPGALVIRVTAAPLSDHSSAIALGVCGFAIGQQVHDSLVDDVLGEAGGVHVRTARQSSIGSGPGSDSA